MASSASDPLLASASRTQNPDRPGSISNDSPASTFRLIEIRQKCQRLLVSRNKHFLVMAVVALDVAGILANIFIKLISCEMHQSDEPWVKTVTFYIEIVSLALSSFFVIELAACLFAFGFGYLKSWFHAFDSAVIIISFIIDISTQGLAESIGSLVVVLRLWRLAKISDEVILGAAERMEVLELHLEELYTENKHLRGQLGLDAQDNSGGQDHGA